MIYLSSMVIYVNLSKLTNFGTFWTSKLRRIAAKHNHWILIFGMIQDCPVILGKQHFFIWGWVKI